jgi:hypothetical protein
MRVQLEGITVFFADPDGNIYSLFAVNPIAEQF